MSGNNGIIQYVANAPVPGAYNYTYNIFHNGNSVVNKRYLNYLSNENLYPITYEIYPQISSISPKMGSVAGGTLLTITGTGFTDDGMGGTVRVSTKIEKCIKTAKIFYMSASIEFQKFSKINAHAKPIFHDKSLLTKH